MSRKKRPVGTRKNLGQATIESLCERIFIVKDVPQRMKLGDARARHKDEGLQRYYEIPAKLLFTEDPLESSPFVKLESRINTQTSHVQERSPFVRVRLEKTYAHYALRPFDLLLCIKRRSLSGKLILWRDFGQPEKFVLQPWMFVVFRFWKPDDAARVFYYLEQAHGRRIINERIGKDKNCTLDWQGLKTMVIPLDDLAEAPRWIALQDDMSYLVPAAKMLWGYLHAGLASAALNEIQSCSQLLQQMRRKLKTPDLWF